MNPELLERIIDAYLFLGINASDKDERDYAFRKMGEYIGKRSEETVAAMEEAKGLT